MSTTDVERHGAWFSSPTAATASDVELDDGRGGLRAAFISLLTLVNFLVPFAAGLWLAYRGHRIEAGIGIGLGIALPFVWSVAAFWPTTLIASTVTQRGRQPHPVLVVLVSFAAAGWQYCVIAAWTLGVFLFFEGRAYPAIALPMLAWAYGTVMGPLSYMASKDPGLDSAPSLALMFAFVVCLVIALMYLTNATMQTTVWCLAALAVGGALLNAVLAGRAAARQRKARRVLPVTDKESELGRELHRALRGKLFDSCN